MTDLLYADRTVVAQRVDHGAHEAGRSGLRATTTPHRRSRWRVV